MAFLPLRPVPLPGDTDQRYGRWLDSVRERLDDPGVDRNDLCRQILTGLYVPGLAGVDPDTLDPDARVLVDQLDPRNVTLEPEYYRELDVDRYARVKPLLWLWEMFDRSPAGENTALGVRSGTTSWFTATSCWTIEGASGSGTASRSRTSPTSTRTRTTSSTGARSSCPKP